MHKSKSQTKITPTAQIFSSIVQMRFKPNNQNASESLARRKQKIQKSKKQLVEIYDPSTMALQADRKIESLQSRRLKFVVSLSAQHFLVGNQNQLDMIGFGAIAHSYVQTDFFWSFSLRGPIESVVVDPKRSIFVLLSESTLYFYRYSVKSKQHPELIVSLQVKEGVRFIRFLKDILLGVFYNTSYQIYNIQNFSLIKKKLQKNYPVDSEKKLLTIPPSIENIINIFFEEPKEKKQSFILWCLEINFGNEQIKTRELYRVYDIMNYVKGKLSIQNYTKEIIFMNLNHQIMAIKNGYLIDSVNVSVKGQGEFLKYIHPETILHITKKHVEVYNFSINMAVKPQKIVLRSVDSIELERYPQNAFYIAVLRSFHNNFAIFFQDSDKKSRQTKGEISYYFEVTQTTSIKMKIKNLFDSLGYGDVNPQMLEEKYNMALKMGLTQKQIYLEIWNRSNRSSHLDYQYILATRDYKTIKMEIQKKLKKESMNLREILKIQESCHQINKQKIDSATCNQEDLQDFVSSHFLLKKLKLFKEIHIPEHLSSIAARSEEGQNSENKQQQLKIDVQQYYHFKNFDIKTFLLDQINNLLVNLGNNAKIIRMTIKDFKFIFRLIYTQILEELIVSFKDNLINLLNQIPEILPYVHKDLNDEERKEGFYSGIWGQVETYQWEQSLYPESIQSIHNKKILSQFVNSVWFKRYWLTAHGMTAKSKKEILKINQFNNSQKIFYFFLAKLYEHCRNNKEFYQQIVNFLQEKYEMFPSHIKNKIVLYENLYTYYFNQEKNNPNRLSLTQFFQWDDESLFKYFFDHQKVKKNSLLKEIKPIYEQSDPRGSHIFNIGLFSYFYSNRSQISDLKFILNRINNQKAQFHRDNHGIYQVLVRSMQLKLRIGSPKDIPIDEVMVYIQNIPFDQGKEIKNELEVMQDIKAQVKIFQKMKIDMTVKDIMEKFEVVMEKILSYFIESNGVLELNEWQSFRGKSLQILRQTERIKKRIYKSEQNSNYTLLVYLSMIMRSQSLIDKVARLLEDEEVHQLFQVEEKTIENIVFYMFKWKFSQSAKYVDNAEYLRKLLDLLPTENQCRVYLFTQLQIGLILSSEICPFLYPLGQNSHCPTFKTIQEVFKAQSQTYLLSLDLNELHGLLQKMEKIVNSEFRRGTITLHKLYEILIVEMLQKELYRQVIDYIYKILKLETHIKNEGILYVGLYIYKIAKEFNEESKKCIFRLFALYFKEPEALLGIMEFIIKTRLTGLQQSKYLKGINDRQSLIRSNFNHHNSILSKEFTSQHQQLNTKKVIEVYREYLKSKNQEFQLGSQYDIIFTILCHSPYLLIKFLQLQREHLRFKEIGMFIQMTVNRPIFSQKKSYEVLKRIFTSLVISSKQHKDIDALLVGFQSKSSEEEFQVPKFTKLSQQQTKIIRIVRSFTRAEQKLKRKQSISKEDLKEKKILHIRALVDNPQAIFQDKFDVEDSDSQPVIVDQKDVLKQTKALQITFNYSTQKSLLFFRKEPFKQFLQGYYHNQKMKTGQLELIRKHSAPSLSINKLTDSVKNYKAKRNQMIERLHSHRVVVGSECQDDPQSRKDDEQFLDYFLPKKGVAQSRSSLGSVRSSRARVIPQELSSVNSNIVVQSQEKISAPIDQQCFLTETKNKEEQSQQNNHFELLREELMRTFNQSKIPRFEILPIQQQISSIQTQSEPDNTQRIEVFLQNFFTFLYSQSPQHLSVNLKLIQDIARKYPAAGVNNFFLQAYQRTLTTHQKHGLQMNIAQILPLSGIYIKSKDIIDLYHEIQHLIVAKITDQNVFKLSKLIALGFRKSIVQQQILFNYLKALMKSYLKCSQDEITALMEKIKSILLKLQVQVVVEKGEDLFKELAEGERRNQLLTTYTQSLKNKGYGSAARELISKLA